MLRPVVHAVSMAICSISLYVAFSVPAQAQASAAQQLQSAGQNYNIPAGPLAPALRSLASSANILLTFTAEQTAGKTTTGLNGKYMTQAAFAALRAGTGLQSVQLDNGGYILRAAPVASAASKEDEAILPVVMVRGSAHLPGDLLKPYAGGQVARGGRLDILGNMDIMDAPFSITSYTAELIENQQARSILDMVANDPSVRGGFRRAHFIKIFRSEVFHLLRPIQPSTVCMEWLREGEAQLSP